MDITNFSVTFFIVSAISYTTSQAWNSAFQSFFQSRMGLKKYGPWIYAIVLTITAILVVKIMKDKIMAEKKRLQSS